MAPQFDVLNATSFQSSLAPGVVAVIFGENITPATQLGCIFSEQVGWGENLGGVEVLVNQKPAAIGAHCRIPQADGLIGEVITCQFPRDIGQGDAEVIILVDNVASDPIQVTLQSHAPAVADYFAPGGQKLGAFQRVPSGEVVSPKTPAAPGEVLSIIANGLGPTDPEIPEGEVSPAPGPATSALPEIEMDGEPVEVLTATLRPGFVGVYEVTFRTPSPPLAGFHRVRLRVEGIASNEVLLPAGETTGPLISAIVNGGSFAPNAPAAPGSILSLFVANLESGTNTNLFPATLFEGLSVDFNGVSAPLFAVVPAAGQINVLVPTEFPETGDVDVTISTAEGPSSMFALSLTPASPGIFRMIDPTTPNRHFATALLANTAWLTIPDGMATAMDLPTDCVAQGIDPASYCGRPVRPGEPIQLFLTGLGKATPGADPDTFPLATGQVAPMDGNPLYQTVVLPEVMIGDLPAVVTFSGLAPGFAGLYQINAIVPLDTPPGDAVPVRVSTPNGLTDSALIAVQ